MILEELKILLYKIQSVYDSHRERYIKEFQEKVWNDETIQNEEINEMLTEIAYDLDFYDPNKEKRKEFHGYYGSDRLSDEIKSAIDRLEKYCEQRQ